MTTYDDDLYWPGDLVTRDGTDLHEVIERTGYAAVVVRCVRAPKTSWIKVGETELNLSGRYQLVSSAGRKAPAPDVMDKLEEAETRTPRVKPV